MSATNLGLDSPAHPLWLVAANILGDSLTILDNNRFGDVYVHCLATLIGDLVALRVDDLLLPDLLHLDAVIGGDVVAVLHWHHRRLLQFNNLAILCWPFYAILLRVVSRSVDINRLAHFVGAP